MTKCKETTLFSFDETLFVNKNSTEFDLKLLNKMKQLKDKTKADFEKEIKKILKEKSGCKVWQSYFKNMRDWCALSCEYRETNYKCAPISRKANYYFCLLLQVENDKITVADGFLRSV